MKHLVSLKASLGVLCSLSAFLTEKWPNPGAFQLSLRVARRAEKFLSFPRHLKNNFSDWHLPVLHQHSVLGFCSVWAAVTSTLFQLLLSQVAIMFSFLWSEIFEFCLCWSESCWYYSSDPISEISGKSNPALEVAHNLSQLSDSHKCRSIFSIQVVKENI